MDPKEKFYLFFKHKHFCAVPWNHLEIFSNGKIQTCSKGTFFGDINTDPIEKILQNDTIKNIKQDLLDDKLIDNCKACHKLSTKDEHFDLRNHYNPMFKNFDVNYTDLEEFHLNAIDLHWDNTCNLKCVYCNPYQSSQIAAEQNIKFNKLDNENIEKIINLIVDNQWHIKEIYFSGGEPLLIKHNKQLLQRIDNKDLPIRINSNITMCNDQNSVFAELKKFKNVLWTVSADSMGERFNYIRHGANWDQFINNLETIKQLGHQLRLNSVFFIGNLIAIFDTIDYFVKKHNITDITINQLDDHQYLLPRNASKQVKLQALQKLNDLLESGIISDKSNSYYNIARCAKELEHDIDDPIGYQNYFDSLDSLRNTNWRSVFTELVS
jgi:molybdenum cofactor biosynthesis enzyme MoaA